MQRKTNKLNLRRETLTNLDLQQANGGAISRANTVQSICQVCYPRPVITEHLTWPIEIEPSLVGPGGGL